MNRLLMFLAALSCAGFPVATAEEYWIAYEGNDFPENVGWTRIYGDEYGQFHGGAERWIEDGALVIDSLRHLAIVDWCEMSRPVNPEPGELFTMQWRLSIDEIISGPDPVAGVFSDGYEAASFQLSDTSLRSVFENRTISIDLLGWHHYELRSSDMATYELFVDRQLAIAGVFSDVYEASRVGWGDGIQGGASLTRWDFVRFGVVPEPSTVVGFALTGMVAILFRKRGGWPILRAAKGGGAIRLGRAGRFRRCAAEAIERRDAVASALHRRRGDAIRRQF